MHASRTISGLYLLATVLTFSMVSYGCSENNPTATPQESVQPAEDNALIENEMASVFEMIDDDATENATFGKVSGASDLTPPCAQRSIDTAARTLTIDFGPNNCLCKDGINRRGKIVAKFTGNYRDIGANVVITPVEYYVNNNKVSGTLTVARTAQQKFTLAVASASVVTDNGTIAWQSERSIERVAGAGTKTPWDDVYLYSGTASGTSRSGKSFTVGTTMPLKKTVEVGCMTNFVAGEVTLKVGTQTMTLNYDPIGGEPCDKVAEVTLNGVAKRIALR